jgi:hypothetical protein
MACRRRCNAITHDIDTLDEWLYSKIKPPEQEQSGNHGVHIRKGGFGKHILMLLRRQLSHGHMTDRIIFISTGGKGGLTTLRHLRRGHHQLGPIWSDAMDTTVIFFHLSFSLHFMTLVLFLIPFAICSLISCFSLVKDALCFE